jgi:ABC-type multidrug transport system permease subunit
MKEKVKFIQDIPVGVLLIVLAQFVFYGVVYIAKFPSLWELMGIVFLTLVSTDMVSYGIKLIKGYEFDKSE